MELYWTPPPHPRKVPTTIVATSFGVSNEVPDNEEIARGMRSLCSKILEKVSGMQKDKFKQYLEEADDRGGRYYSRWLITEDLVQIFPYSRAVDRIILGVGSSHP